MSSPFLSKHDPTRHQASISLFAILNGGRKMVREWLGNIGSGAFHSYGDVVTDFSFAADFCVMFLYAFLEVLLKLSLLVLFRISV